MSLEWKIGTGLTLFSAVMAFAFPSYSALWCSCLFVALVLLLDGAWHYFDSNFPAQSRMRLLKKGLVLEAAPIAGRSLTLPRIGALLISGIMSFALWSRVESDAIDSYPYVIPSVALDSGEVKVTLHVGSRKNRATPASLKFVRGEFTDIDALEQIVAKLGRPPVDEEAWRAIRWIEAREVAPGGILRSTQQFFKDKQQVEVLKIPKGTKSRRFKFDPVSSTGNYHEEIYLAKSGGLWKSTGAVWSNGGQIYSW